MFYLILLKGAFEAPETTESSSGGRFVDTMNLPWGKYIHSVTRCCSKGEK